MYWDKKIYDVLSDGLNVGDLNVTVHDQIKKPQSHLNWVVDDNMPYNIYQMYTSFPDKVLHGELHDGENHRAFRYSEFGNADSLEMGIETRNLMEGSPKYIHVTPHSVVYVNSVIDDPVHGEKTWIYKAPDIHTAPELITENDSGSAIEMSCHSYYDGITDIILVGMYGRGPGVRDLLMSTDGGDTFELIKQTTLIDPTKNSHWHAVWFDHYQSRIWASEGDHDNRNLHYTDDYGLTWHQVDGDKPFEERHQPTLILGWADRVIFGRDATQKDPGFDVFERQYSSADKSNPVTVKDHYSILMDTVASDAYPRRAIAYSFEGEAYVLFRSSIMDSTILVATGDRGLSWHGVHSGRFSSARLRAWMAGITHEGYIAGVVAEHPTINTPQFVYAKKIEWEY